MYGPFAKLIGQWGSVAGANEMPFSSMPRGSLSGLSFYPFRAYEPNFQRWINRDPIQELGGINLYRFSFNNPSEWLDPQGLQSEDFEPPEENADDQNEQFPDRDQPLPTGFAESIGPANPPPEPPMSAEQFAENIQKMTQEQEDLDKELENANERKGQPPASKAPCPERVRHYTSPEALRSIKKSQQLQASRPADNPGVWFTRQPFPASTSDPQVGSAGSGAYVETDAPQGMQAVQYPGESPWGFVPTGGAPFNIGDLNPTFVGLGPFGLW